MKGNHVVRAGQYVRFKEINMKRSSEISESLITEDIERIVRRLRRAGFDFDECEIHVQVKDVGVEPAKIEERTLFETFIKEPGDVKSELHLDQIITYMIKYDVPFEEYTIHFLRSFISINYDGNEDEFEMEYNLNNLSDIKSLSAQEICDIMNTELEWMGLGWEVSPIIQPKRKIDFRCKK